jgi:Zn finger protein HypA/HybF involved in hydrogenase expression
MINMTSKRVIEMIDEYLLEPNSIQSEWVEALKLCRRVLIDGTANHSKWEISFDGYYPYCLNCGYGPDIDKLSDYCPKCGCRMDGGKNA